MDHNLNRNRAGFVREEKIMVRQNKTIKLKKLRLISVPVERRGAVAEAFVNIQVQQN